MVNAFETSGSSPPPLPDELVEPFAEILAEAVVEYLRKSASEQRPSAVPSVPLPEGTIPRAA
jgi:hypothetical protein